MFFAYMAAGPDRSIKRAGSSPALLEAAEEAFLEKYNPAEFERPSVTVDVVLLTARDGELHTLVVQRAEPPAVGRWALPGGFVRIREPLEDAAHRVLRTKCSLENVYVEQLCTFGEPDRDPRMRVISVGYFALVDARRFDRACQAQSGARHVTMARIVVPWNGDAGGAVHLVDAQGEELPLAFDHADILAVAVKRIRGKLDYSPIGFQLLPERFTLLALQGVHETVLGRKLNKDSFRRRMLSSGELVATGEMQSGVDHRPAELYRFLKRSAI